MGADSIELLRVVGKKLLENGYTLCNADCTVIAQRPKLAPYIDTMRQRLADALRVDVDCISVKATTEEKLGFTVSDHQVKFFGLCKECQEAQK